MERNSEKVKYMVDSATNWAFAPDPAPVVQVMAVASVRHQGFWNQWQLIEDGVFGKQATQIYRYYTAYQLGVCMGFHSLLEISPSAYDPH